MFITDLINLAFANPLVGPNLDGGPRFPDMSAPYDPDWTDRAEQAALEAGIPTRRGTYIWAMGPSYETPAEIRAFARLGADAVGMSTVPEVIDRKSTRLNSSHVAISYAVFCLKKKTHHNHAENAYRPHTRLYVCT